MLNIQAVFKLSLQRAVVGAGGPRGSHDPGCCANGWRVSMRLRISGSGTLIIHETLSARVGSVRETETGDLNGPDRRWAGSFVMRFLFRIPHCVEFCNLGTIVLYTLIADTNQVSIHNSQNHDIYRAFWMKMKFCFYRNRLQGFRSYYPAGAFWALISMMVRLIAEKEMYNFSRGIGKFEFLFPPFTHINTYIDKIS